MAQNKLLPRNVHATYQDATTPTPGGFLKQAHPNVQVYPIMLNRSFHKKNQNATDARSFFVNKGKSGTGAIEKTASGSGSPGTGGEKV